MEWLYPLADDTTTLDQVWRMGGWVMYPLMLLAMGAIPVALGLFALHMSDGRKRGTRRFAVLLIAYAALPIGLGVLGAVGGNLMMYEALASVDPAERDEILAHGRAEAAVPLRLGLFIGAPLLLLGAGMIGTLRKKPEEDAPAPAPSGG